MGMAIPVLLFTIQIQPAIVLAEVFQPAIATIASSRLALR
jgi:hypothetical protein